MFSAANLLTPVLASIITGALGAFLAVALAGVAWLVHLRRQDSLRMKELAESESRLRMLFDRSPDAATLFDTRSGRFTHCNEAALRLLRADRDWIVGKHPWQIAPERQPDGTLSADSAKALIERVNLTGAARFEWQHLRGDGTSFPAEISITALEISDQPLWMAVIRDVTDWKRAQEAAALANQSLELRVSERTAELGHANEQLRQAGVELQRALAAERELGELKSNFVSMVSHEFRTPLGIIASSSQILERYFARLDEEARLEHLGAIGASVHRMAAMMENVLLLSRMDRSRMEFAPVELELDPFFRRLTDEMRSAASAALPITLEIAPDVPETIRADENLLRHILTNLLSNAVKYSALDTSARLTVSRTNEALTFAVADAGIGIPEEDRPHLFETFHRGSNVGQRPGTGLGLVIVKRCCDLHGASIDFTSQPGCGTTFTVTLPLSNL